MSYFSEKCSIKEIFCFDFPINRLACVGNVDDCIDIVVDGILTQLLVKECQLEIHILEGADLHAHGV